MPKNIPIIKHPGAALIIPFVSRNKVILLRQYRPVIRKYMYELPAGTLEEGESVISCARRELVEETGFSAAKFVKSGYIYPVPGYSTERIMIYKALGLRLARKKLEEDEIIEHIFVDRKKVKHLFKAGKINDAKTICAFCLCGWL